METYSFINVTGGFSEGFLEAKNNLVFENRYCKYVNLHITVADEEHVEGEKDRAKH